MTSYIAAIALLTVIARPTAAQPTFDPRLGAAVAALRVGAPIRVATSGARADGQFLGATFDSLVMSGGTAGHHLPLAAVDTLWLRDRATRRGAVIGAVTGGLGLALFVAVVAGSICQTPAECRAGGRAGVPLVIGGGFVLGAGGGALLGAAVGSVTHRWRRLYP